ncbi:hypothetical protein F4820DRAFT_438813 [Hypoxylon rubiginosum]|uniref:Uncharacterized protein n=1 Tax=Hypoxylon rubiginosum TaxID=110542 RepID=A0ACB9YKU8_9PEZI|nr:hypothetical protein F4820DRAFT_438813 [Hypoxylon rubiginosum]
MVKHCEEGTCWKKLHLYLRYEDGRGLFTEPIEKPLIENGSFGTLDTSSGTYDCWRCGLGFNQVGALMNHYQRLGHKPLQFMCPQPYCGDTFAQFHQLLGHLEELDCGGWIKEYGGEDHAILTDYMDCP